MPLPSSPIMILSLAAVLASCGSKGGGETEATGEASSDGSGSGTGNGTGTGTATGTGAATGTASEGPTTGAAVCEPFLDQPVDGPEVVVTIENASDEVAFVLPGPPCTSDPLLRLSRDGEPLSFRNVGCDFTCDDLFTQDCLCAADCALAPTIRLEPGGSYTYTWSGALFVPVMPPASCFFGTDCGEMCDQRQQAPAGQYAFSTQVGASVPACTDSPELCTCTPEPEGWCALYGVGATDIEGAAAVMGEFAYPGETAVALVVQ